MCPERTDGLGDSLYRRLVEAMRCGVLVVDHAGGLLLLNEPGREILDLPDPPPLGARLSDYLSPFPQLIQLLEEAFEFSSPPNRAELELEFPSRSERRVVGLTMSLVPGSDGKPDVAVLLFKDLSRLERRDEQEQLRLRLLALGQTAAGMAHQLRSPLTSIDVTACVLQRRFRDDPGSQELLRKISTEVHRLGETVSTILEYVKPLSLERVPADLQPVLEEALALSLDRHGRRRIRIDRRFRPGLPHVLMDRGQLRQAFENLFLNGFQAMGDAGTLLVETTVGRGYVIVNVADSGPGVPPENRDKLFLPFFTTKPDGSGVGLPLARKIVESHRGLIDLASQVDGGARFTVKIPAVSAAVRGSAS